MATRKNIRPYKSTAKIHSIFMKPAFALCSKYSTVGLALCNKLKLFTSF